MRTNAVLEDWDGSATVRSVGQGYERKPANEFRDLPADLSSRQAIFYKNLIAIALDLGTNAIPVDFEDAGGNLRYLDRGCIKIAEHARFIEALQNDKNGIVSTIFLNWQVRST